MDELYQYDVFPIDLYIRRREIGPIVLSQNVPEVFHKHIKRVKRCYHLGAFDAAIVFSRSVLEEAVIEFLKRKGALKNQQGIINIDPWKFLRLINTYQDYLPSRGTKSNCIKIAKSAGQILHDSEFEISQNECLDLIKKTFIVIEELYK